MIGLGATLAGAKSLIETAKSAIDAHDERVAKKAVSDLELKLFEATALVLETQEELIKFKDMNRCLEHEVQDLKLQAEDRESHPLTEIRPGAYAHAMQPVQEVVSKPTDCYLCQPCFDAHTHSVLRYEPPTVASDGFWTCPQNAEHKITHPGTQLPAPSFRRRDIRSF